MIPNNVNVPTVDIKDKMQYFISVIIAGDGQN